MMFVCIVSMYVDSSMSKYLHGDSEVYAVLHGPYVVRRSSLSMRTDLPKLEIPEAASVYPTYTQNYRCA
jgi:hypothetical protein